MVLVGMGRNPDPVGTDNILLVELLDLGIQEDN
jgi:hypothetical protein